MKKKLLLMGALLLAATGLKAQMNPAGAAAFNPATGVLNLVPGAGCGGHVNGAGWSPTTVDFTRSFVLDYDASFTTTGGSGADGHVVVFGSNINTAVGGSVGGTGGGHMGYYFNNTTLDFNQSIGIEFDIFENGAVLSDPGTGVNHTMIAQDANPTIVLAPAVSIDPAGLSVEDGLYHHYRVEWLCGTGRLRVYFDGNLRIDIPFNPAAVFSNPAIVNWGFTGARQASCSQHLIKNIVMTTSDQCDPCMHATLETFFVGCDEDGNYEVAFSLFANPGPDVVIGQYMLYFGDGGQVIMPGAFPFSPIHDYAPGTYTVTLIVVGYNRKTGECCREVLTATIYVPDCREIEGGGGSDGRARIIPGSTTDLNLYPNPTKGELLVNMATGSFNKVTITDATGKIVFEQSFDAEKQKSINLADLSNGIYMVEIAGENGQLYREKVQINK